MRPMRKADNITTFLCVVMKSGNLNFVEPSGPLQACNGTALNVIPVAFRIMIGLYGPYCKADAFLDVALRQLVSKFRLS